MDRDINNGVAVGTVAYVGRDSSNIIGVAFNIQLKPCKCIILFHYYQMDRETKAGASPF
jgi:hypothetical protein